MEHDVQAKPDDHEVRISKLELGMDLSAKSLDELRIALGEQKADFRQAMTEQSAEFRQAMTEQKVEFRQAMAEQKAEFRQAMAELQARQEKQAENLWTEFRLFRKEQQTTNRWLIGLLMANAMGTATIIAKLY